MNTLAPENYRLDERTGLMVPASAVAEPIEWMRDIRDTGRERPMFRRPEHWPDWVAEPRTRSEFRIFNEAIAKDGGKHLRPPWTDRDGHPGMAGGSTAAAYSAAASAVFAATTGAKTFLNVIAPAGHGLSMVEFCVSMDGVTSSAVPARVDVCQSTQAGAGTSAATPTITQVRGVATSGSAPTGGGNYSAEPTTLTVLKCLYVPQYMGTFIYQFPLGREIECHSSAGTIKSLAIRINVSANVNVLGWVEVEAL